MSWGSRSPAVAIIGSGFAGLAMAVQLKRAGVDSFTIFEKGADVGGIWRDNTYPGCGCDVPSNAREMRGFGSGSGVVAHGHVE